MKSSNKKEVAGDLILMGEIVGVHGMHGALKVRSYAESEDLFEQQERLILIDPDGGRHDVEVASMQTYKHGLRLTIKDVINRDQAESLVGYGIHIPKTDLPPLEDGTYYWVDLLGLEVYSAGGECLGRIVEIIPTGANDVYVVKPDGGDDREVLVPAIASVVTDIDLKKGRMRVTLPEGLV